MTESIAGPDFDADGHADLAIGAAGHVVEGVSAGSVYIVLAGD